MDSCDLDNRDRYRKNKLKLKSLPAGGEASEYPRTKGLRSRVPISFGTREQELRLYVRNGRHDRNISKIDFLVNRCGNIKLKLANEGSKGK